MPRNSSITSRIRRVLVILQLLLGKLRGVEADRRVQAQ
jgi:hypothetical protein